MRGIAERLFLITGAARGIGEAVAARLVEEGGQVIVCDIAEQGEETAELLRKRGGKAHFRKLDVSDRIAVSTLAEAIYDEFGPLHGLVNNAGVAIAHTAFDCSDEVWRKTLQINLDGVYYCCREFGRRMLKHGGSIVNISSIAGLKVVRPETHVAYGVTKAAVAHMASLLGVEWAAHNIRVNAVAPGYTETPILAGMKETNRDVVNVWMKDTPINRMIQPTEIASVVTFLLSDDASCVTGETLAADGGYTKW
jgi:NAD(P)-dependent dehydrogenase (short-subunit alcohol dehydrogenase family)